MNGRDIPPPPPVADEGSPEREAWRAQVFEAGYAIARESGWPIETLVMADPWPGWPEKIADRLRRADARQQAREAAEGDGAVIEFDPLDVEDPEAENIAWAKNILDHLPADLRRQLEQHTERLAAEQLLGFMPDDDDFEGLAELDKITKLIGHGIATGFTLALARYRRPLMDHAPEARRLIGRQDAARRKGAAVAKAKADNVREQLRAMMAAAAADGRELTPAEAAEALGRSRSLIRRRMNEIELE